ncbi:MAG: hypothetical protein ACJ72N_08140 [Labedaea sp.]
MVRTVGVPFRSDIVIGAVGEVTHDRARVAGVAVAMGLWISAVAGLTVIVLLVSMALNRRRSAAWQREWARVEPDWAHRV